MADLAKVQPGQPVIRNATQDDVPAIRNIADVAWQDTYGELLDGEWINTHLAEWYEPSLVTSQITEAEARADCHFMVTEVRGEVVGYLHFQTMADRGPYLRRLYLLPEHQGKGIGMALISELHSRLGSGFEYELDVHPENLRAVTFYEGLGARWTGGHIEPCWDLMRVRV